MCSHLGLPSAWGPALCKEMTSRETEDHRRSFQVRGPKAGFHELSDAWLVGWWRGTGGGRYGAVLRVGWLVLTWPLCHHLILKVPPAPTVALGTDKQVRMKV